jgi:iron-sulfur cluster assembly protein
MIPRFAKVWGPELGNNHHSFACTFPDWGAAKTRQAIGRFVEDQGRTLIFTGAETMFILTPAAAQPIRQAAQASGAAELALRVAAKKDAAGEMHYGMDFDDPKEEHMKLDLEGVAVVIGGESQELLFDTLLDFVELNPGESNFIFVPTSQPSCGSGLVTTGGGNKGATH